MKQQAGKSLVEILGVIAIILILIPFVMEAAQTAQDKSIQVVCMNRLKQLGIVFRSYRNDFHKFPAYSQADGIGDLENWGALYSHTDPGFGYFVNTNTDPRVPRKLEEYADLETLICPTQGASGYWKDLGPYYYNASNPASSETTGFWKAVYDIKKSYRSQALAGCQNPPKNFNDYNRTFRHGKRVSTSGANNQVYADCKVKAVESPKVW